MHIKIIIAGMDYWMGEFLVPIVYINPHRSALKYRISLLQPFSCHYSQIDGGVPAENPHSSFFLNLTSFTN